MCVGLHGLVLGHRLISAGLACYLSVVVEQRLVIGRLCSESCCSLGNAGRLSHRRKGLRGLDRLLRSRLLLGCCLRCLLF